MKYKLKEWEKWDTEALHHIPHYCPNCDESLSKPVGYWTDSSRLITSENPPKGLGYDCYCDYCHWSGNIEPDADSCIVENVEERPKFVKFKFKKLK